MKRIQSLNNILSIKGVAVERLKKLLLPDALVNFDQIIVSEVDNEYFNNIKKLENDQMLINFVIEHKKLVVQYPEGQITLRERKNSLEFEYDFFDLFDS